MATDIILKLIKENCCAHFPWEAVPESTTTTTTNLYFAPYNNTYYNLSIQYLKLTLR